MAHSTQHIPITADRKSTDGLYQTIIILIGATFVVSASIIVLFNRLINAAASSSLGSVLAIAFTSLVPYMISAVIAAITAIAVMKIYPLIRRPQSMADFRDRLKELSEGNLHTHMRVETHDPEMRAIGVELNNAINYLGQNIALWKIINRQQWELLGCIREAGLQNDGEAVGRYVYQMEQNWKRIATAEEKLTT